MDKMLRVCENIINSDTRACWNDIDCEFNMCGNCIFNDRCDAGNLIDLMDINMAKDYIKSKGVKEMKIDINNIIEYECEETGGKRFGRVVEIIEIKQSIRSELVGKTVYKVIDIEGNKEILNSTEVRGNIVKVYKEVIL